MIRFITDRLLEAFSDTVRLQPQYIEVEDTGTAGDVIRVLHNLNRVPRGVRIVNIVHTAAVGWYREAGDADWTKREITLRFDESNARVLLEVF